MIFKLTIMQGPSGSGKSHWANAHKTSNPTIVRILSADDHFIDRQTGSIVPFSATELVMAHKKMYKMFVEIAVSQSKYPTVIIDNTNTRLEHITPYYNLAQAFDIPVNIIQIHRPIEQCLKNNTHNVPEGIIFRQQYEINEFNGKHGAFYAVKHVFHNDPYPGK